MTWQATDPHVAIALRNEIPGVREAVRLAPYCAYGVGGPAEFLVEADSTGALCHAALVGRQLGLPTTVLGQATNVLVADTGLRGLVILTRNREELLDGELLVCGAGAVLQETIAGLADRGMAGLEFAGNIPGSVGGAVVGNAGAYGRAVGDALVAVEVLMEGETVTLSPAELDLGYRTSAFKRRAADGKSARLGAATVLRASFMLTPGSRSELRAEMARDAELRRAKHPLECSSCGSYFKNPSPERPAAFYIQETGLKGLRQGRAEVSTRHANFLIALPGASAADILSLASEVKRRVRDHCGVQLQEEVVYLGFDDPPGYTCGASL